MDILTSLELILPGAEEESRKAFCALKELLGAVSTSFSEDSITLSLPELFPKILFCIAPQSDRSAIILNFRQQSINLPQSLMKDTGARESRMSVIEASKRLKGSIKRVDHAGIIVPADVPAVDWQQATNLLAGSTALFDYPASEEYDACLSRWLFVIPSTEVEQMKNVMDKEQRRQPKFELVYDQTVKNSIVQIDMETSLSREQIIELFPGDDSFDLPGLGGFFRSVGTYTPWAGVASLRLDLRYKDYEDINPWNSATYLIKNGTRIRPEDMATRLPSPQAQENSVKRKAGLLKDKIQISEDFDVAVPGL